VYSSVFENAVCLFQFVLLDDKKYWKNKPQVENHYLKCALLLKIFSVTGFSVLNQTF